MYNLKKQYNVHFVKPDLLQQSAGKAIGFYFRRVAMLIQPTYTINAVNYKDPSFLQDTACTNP